MSKRVFFKGNYFIISDNSAILNDSRNVASNVNVEANDSLFIFYKISDGKIIDTIKYIDILNENGIAYTNQNVFLTLIEQKTGSIKETKQTSEIVDLFLHMSVSNFTVSVNTTVDSNVFEASAGHGIIVGNTLCFLEGKNFSQFNVISVVTNTITVDTPFDRSYSTAITYLHHTPNMNVDGSVTSKVFFTKPLAGTIFDIKQISLSIEDANNMDFSKFGSLSELTNGCVLRKKDGVYKNIFNWKTNGEFSERAESTLYQTKSGGGLNGFLSIKNFADVGTTIRLDGDLNDELQVIIQDDLSGLDKVKVIAQGYLVE